VAYSRNITLAIVNQFFLPGTSLVSVARNDSGQIIAYTYVKANDKTYWSDEPMVSVCMAHVDLTLSARTRVRLVKDMLELWERFAQLSGNKLICSTTMRRDQTAFLRLHQDRGYTVRGSFAYKRVSAT
jgi:hypothetical protein